MIEHDPDGKPYKHNEEQAEASKREMSEPSASDVIMIRCMKHALVPKDNSNEITGAECGGCIIEERNLLKERLRMADNVIREARGLEQWRWPLQKAMIDYDNFVKSAAAS